MSIPRTYWQARTPGPPWETCSPNLRVIERYLTAVAGGQPLGCYGVRPIRGGTSWSSHAFGAAFDWRYENVGAGYQEIGLDTFRTVILPWLIRNADQLGVQQIHDYRAGRIWRTDLGWRTSTAAGMGEAWAGYVHIETNVYRWADVTPISARHVDPLPINTNAVNPATGGTVKTVSFDHAELSRDTEAPDAFVRMWQAILNARWNAALVEDGHYGPLTESAVERAQQAAHVTADGRLGPQTARALLDR